MRTVKRFGSAEYLLRINRLSTMRAHLLSLVHSAAAEAAIHNHGIAVQINSAKRAFNRIGIHAFSAIIAKNL
jgi:hypothetical protein